MRLALVALLACDGGEPPWPPAPGASWQIQLSGELDLSVDADIYDIDLFDTPEADLRALAEDGRRVVCYFSAGSYEDWREDADQYPAEAIGDPLDDWEGEWWVDVRDETVRALLTARLDLAVERGCDGVDPDNVDGYANDNGLGLTAEDQLDFNRWLAEEARARGLAVGLKNDLSQISALEEHFDFAVNEECLDYDECELLSPFTAADKSVLHIEYVDDWADAEARADEVCAAAPELDTLIKTWDLGPERVACE